jgi:hypothetical protein
MRHWLFNPWVFYPLTALAAALIIAISLKPQSWPREPAPVAGAMDGGAIVLEGAAFNAPDVGAEQELTVRRNILGEAHALSIAQKPGQPPPTPAEQGVRILLTAETAALIDDKPVSVEVSYVPLPVNAASGLAVSLQGIGPAVWVSQPTPPQAAVVRFDLPPQFAVNAIGLRALSDGTDQAYGLEITRIRITPAVAAPAPTPAAATMPAPAEAAGN